ncbi:transposable element Tcb2 transposase [Trichonephila clavipes]|nr:transposable element Tcb2 transposase [Trichonephila clavipes]
MDDNARPHRANLVDEFLESEDIKRIPWPANSPDLNPIENLWDYLGRAIARRHPPPRDVNGLKTALLEEWSLISQTVINNVISSLKHVVICVYESGEIIFHIKFSLVYADKPQTLDHLEDNIRRVIADIRPQMLEKKVIENWTSRLDYIRASRSSPMPEIIFKI